MMPKHFPIVLLDWGDTLMADLPNVSTPMVEWPEVRALDGAEAMLRYLKASGRRIMLVTNARASDELQIRAALARVGLDGFIERIACFKNTGLPKGVALFRRILCDLDANAAQVVMIGDSLEKDILPAGECGIHGFWLAPDGADSATGPWVTRVRSLHEVVAHFQALDMPAQLEAS